MSDSIQAQIDAMVTRQAAVVTNPSLNRATRSGDSVGTIRATSDGTNTTVEVLKQPTAPTDRIPDDHNVNTAVEAAKLKADIEGLQAKLDSFTFHQQTGERVMVLEHGSEERARVEKALAWAKRRAALQLEIYRRLDEQRAADAKAAEAQRVRELYVMGDRRKAQMLDEALERKRAEIVATQILQQDINKASGK